MNAHPEFQTVVHTHGPQELDSFDAKISELMEQGWITSFQPFVYGGALCQQMSRWPQAVPQSLSTPTLVEGPSE